MDKKEGADGTLPEADGQTVENQETQAADGGNKVDFATYDKAMKSFSKAKSRAEELEQRLMALEQEKLHAEGNKDELIENLRKQNTDLNSKYKTAVGSFARSKGFDAIVDEAVKLGCTSPRLLKKRVEDELPHLSYDEDFRPDANEVRALVEKARKDEPLIFAKPAPNVGSHTLRSADVSSPGAKPLNQMKEEELMALWEKTNS